MEVIVIDNRSKKEKVRDFMVAAKVKVKALGKKVWENKEIVIPAVIATVGGVNNLSGKLNRRKWLREQELRRTRSFYDRSAQCYWETKRPISTKERIEIVRRHREGESYDVILKSMGLLKRAR